MRSVTHRCCNSAPLGAQRRARVVVRTSRFELCGAASVIAAALVSSHVLIAPAQAWATGLESVELPTIPGAMLKAMEPAREVRAGMAAQERAAEEAFQNSDLLKDLKARSEANKAQRKRELEDKYCRRQAEIGVGDCAGLRLIPGMTQSGRQKPPKEIMDFFGLDDSDYDGLK